MLLNYEMKKQIFIYLHVFIYLFSYCMSKCDLKEHNSRYLFVMAKPADATLFNHIITFINVCRILWGARWLSGRVSDSGARGPGFETYRRRVVSLSKTLYSPKVLVNYPGSDGSVPT